MFVRICLCHTILYTCFGKTWRQLKKFWGWKICLVYAYFFKHLSLSMLTSFILIKKECNTYNRVTYICPSDFGKTQFSKGLWKLISYSESTWKTGTNLGKVNSWWLRFCHMIGKHLLSYWKFSSRFLNIAITKRISLGNKSL